MDTDELQLGCSLPSLSLKSISETLLKERAPVTGEEEAVAAVGLSNVGIPALIA